MIDLMPPGLYEAVITEVMPDLQNPSSLMASICCGWRLER